MAYTILPSLSANKVLTASYLNQINDDLQIISKHNHSGSTGEGSASINSSGSAASPFVYRIEFVNHIVPSALGYNVNPAQSSVNIFGAVRNPAASVPACIMYPVSLMSGTYNIQIMHTQSLVEGIASVLMGTSVIGQIDAYSSVTDNNAVCSLAASIPTSASYVFTVRLGGNKNASSTGSRFQYQAVKIKRTGNY